MRREDWQPPYLRLEQAGELAHRAQALYLTLRNCRLCPRLCGVNRSKGEKGICQSSSRVKVAAPTRT
jgi:putative pyruvate formate lyase activating enzyme